MIARALVVVFLVAATFGPAIAQSPDPVAAARAFDEARALVRRDAGAMWGRSLEAPLLIVDPATRRAVASAADAEGRLSRVGRVFVGTIPASVPVANTAAEWAGNRWTMVLWPLPSDARERARLLVHELFHGLQPELGFVADSPPNPHLDSVDGRYWLQLEWRALRAALLGSGRARRAAVADALAFRARRRALLPTVGETERALEMNEGLAEYTGVRLAMRDVRERASAAAGSIDQAGLRPSFVRSFAYVSGPAYGLLLDARSTAWRRGLTAKSDLGAELAKAFKIRPDASTAEARAARYDGAALLEAERARARAREERLAAYTRRFVEGPVLRISLEGARFSFDPNALIPLGEHGTVYPESEFSGVWGVLKVTGGVLVSADWSTLTVPAPASASALEGPGWSLAPAPNWQIVLSDRRGNYLLTKK